MAVSRNKLQQIRDALMEDIEKLSISVAQTAMDNIDNPKKWFDKSAYYHQSEEITLSAIYKGIEVGGEGKIALVSLTQTSQYYLYSKYKTGTLSARLHANTAYAQQVVNDTMARHIKAKTTWRRVQKDLIKSGVSPADNPKWLKELEQTALYYGGDKKSVQQALKKAKRAVSKLRPDRELRKAYQSVIDTVESPNFDMIALKKAMQRSAVKKIAYNNERIVRTELSRAYNDAFWRRVEDDPDITLVKHELSSGHNVVDECDFVADTDAFGYGAGVYPVGQAYNVPIHCNCLCQLTPMIRHIDDKRRGRFSEKRFEEHFSDYSPSMQKRIKAMGEPRKPHALPKDLVL